MLLTTNCRLTETKSGTFVSQHVRPFLLFHGRLPPTSVASKIEEFGTLAACLCKISPSLHFLHSCVSERREYWAELANAVWILIFVLLIMHKCHGANNNLWSVKFCWDTVLKLGSFCVMHYAELFKIAINSCVKTAQLSCNVDVLQWHLMSTEQIFFSSTVWLGKSVKVAINPQHIATLSAVKRV